MEFTEEDLQTLRLTKALLGSLSGNFRQVSLELGHDGAVTLHFLLEAESRLDRDEIDDIAFEFEALQEREVETTVDVAVDNARRVLPGRLVFARREAEE